MDNLFVQPASRTLIACPGRTDGLCPSQVERNNDVGPTIVRGRRTQSRVLINTYIFKDTHDDLPVKKAQNTIFI